MNILSIETSCDETAISVLKITGKYTSPNINILGNALFSQTKIHEKYGGVFPMLAKREHAKNITPLLKKALKQSGFIKKSTTNTLSTDTQDQIKKILMREEMLSLDLIKFLNAIKKPKIDVITVTNGPGLEPALWVGISAAEAIAKAWNIPIVPVNHMEGHIMSVLFNPKKKFKLLFPAIALLISGGHTELIYIEKPLSYKTLGATRDDAVGEAYDKVARMLGLPYPGGPQIASFAEISRKSKRENLWVFPRPMINSSDYDFSFSGLKTSVLYAIKDKKLKLKDKEDISRAFEDAVTEVLLTKTKKALSSENIKTLIIGGGVIANNHIRKAFKKMIKDYKPISLIIPEKKLSTDNSIMIGIAGYAQIKKFGIKNSNKISAEGNLKF